MSQVTLTKSALMDRFGESHKQIERYVGEGMPCEGVGHKRRFPWPEVRNWRDERIRKQERDRAEKDQPADLDKLRARKMELETREIEIRVETTLGALVPLEAVSDAVGRVVDAAMPVLQNMPSNYGLRLEEVGVPPDVAERVLESIATDLTQALQDTAGLHDEAADQDEANEADDSARLTA